MSFIVAQNISLFYGILFIEASAWTWYMIKHCILKSEVPLKNPEISFEQYLLLKHIRNMVSVLSYFGKIITQKYRNYLPICVCADSPLWGETIQKSVLYIVFSLNLRFGCFIFAFVLFLWSLFSNFILVNIASMSSRSQHLNVLLVTRAIDGMTKEINVLSLKMDLLATIMMWVVVTFCYRCFAV